MRKSYLPLILICCICFGTFLLGEKAHAQPARMVSMQVFYDELSAYGQWVEDPEYGYVWMPDVPPDFRPYCTAGYWVMTDYGNTWVSGYSWGWIPFHYGRWMYNSYYGWLWVPGYEWGPAWVCWRGGDGYYGWAPIGPWFTVTINIGAYHCPDNWWIFTPYKHLHRRYQVYEPRHSQLVSRTTVINNIYDGKGERPLITGPKADEIYKNTGKDVQVYKVMNAERDRTVRVNRDNTVEIYRPEVSYEGVDRLKPNPEKIIRSMHPAGKDPEPVQDRSIQRDDIYHKPQMSDQRQNVQQQNLPTPQRGTEQPRINQQPRPNAPTPQRETERPRINQQPTPNVPIQRRTPVQPRINQQPQQAPRPVPVENKRPVQQFDQRPARESRPIQAPANNTPVNRERPTAAPAGKRSQTP